MTASMEYVIITKTNTCTTFIHLSTEYLNILHVSSREEYRQSIYYMTKYRVTVTLNPRADCSGDFRPGDSLFFSSLHEYSDHRHE